MAKIWEIDFTKCSGTAGAGTYGASTVNFGYLQDNINDIPALQHGGAAQEVDPLPQFTTRSGIKHNTGTYSSIVFDTGHSTYTWKRTNDPAPLNINGNFSGVYTRRSFVVWFYLHGSAETGTNGLYGENDSSTSPRAGFFMYNGSQFRCYANSSNIISSSFGDLQQGTWHCGVITIDRAEPKTRLYLDGELVGSSSTVHGATSLLATSPYAYLQIGDINGSREANVTYGYLATYDEKLSPASISGIYETFLIDSVTGDDPAFSVSGTVFDVRDLAISGAPVYLINTDDDSIAHITTTSGDGSYVTHIPFAGDYVLVTANDPPAIGARALSLSASGVAGSGSITFYDGS
jgi:hypothetical protein